MLLFFVVVCFAVPVVTDYFVFCLLLCVTCFIVVIVVAAVTDCC